MVESKLRPYIVCPRRRLAALLLLVRKGASAGLSVAATASLMLALVGCDTEETDRSAGTSSGSSGLGLALVIDGFDRPLFVAQAPGVSDRLWVVEQPGRIAVVSLGAAPVRQAEPFLDIEAQVLQRGNEQGLLGLAFHPDFDKNGLFYLNYTTVEGRPAGATVVSEWRALPGDTARAESASERVLLTIDQPESNHNGGGLAFGPDGHLYIGLGDGGGGGDQHGTQGNGQNLQTLLGKMLRIDVDHREASEPYTVPSGNYADATGEEALPEIWSVGWRNPWRFSFDRDSGGLYVADVGQNASEEVSYEAPGGPGRNYGWRLMEAERCFNPSEGCDAEAAGLVLPVASYGRDLGVSVTGGYVYRGAAIDELVGSYLYADFVTGNFWSLKIDEDGTLDQPSELITDRINPGRQVRGISSFGQDNAGELYVTSFTNGALYSVVGR